MCTTLKNKNEFGLTLIEVLVAVLVLGMSISTIFGLQSSILRRTLQDKNQRTAMLLARTILAKIEIDPDEFSTQDTSMTAAHFIKQKIGDYGYDKESLKEAENYDVFLTIKNQEVPIFSEESGLDIAEMKEIRLKIYWGEADDESIEVVLYTKEKDNLK